MRDGWKGVRPWVRLKSQAVRTGEQPEEHKCESSPEYRNFDRIDGEPMKFEWNISQDSIRCSSVSQEVKHILLRLGEAPENFTGRIIFMSMFNDISCGSRDNETECESNA